MNFGIHPSQKLQELFSDKPYQIQEPERAKLIFLGRDANWDINLEDNPLFSEFEEYFQNGISYWENHGYHTPMLNPNYKGEGKTYHRTFKRIGFTSDYAKDICFLELLKVPTYGKSSGKNEKEYLKMVMDDRNKTHLNRIREIQQNTNIHILIPYGLREIIEKYSILDINSKNIFFHKHFSNPTGVSDEEIKRIRQYCLSSLNK